MNRAKRAAALPIIPLVISLAQGCATSTPQAVIAATAAAPSSPPVVRVAQITEVPVEKDAPPAQGHPLTSVVVTQCNLIVAVYMTMPDGRLLRFDHSTQMPVEQLMSMAYTATRSERVEVSCNDTGAVGYEHHDPV